MSDETEKQLETEVRYVLDNAPKECVVRIREGGGEENLAASLGVTFAKMNNLARRAVEAERSEEQLCIERDDAEQALSQAFYLITGRSPEWSNHFGYKEALEEIDDAQRVMRESLSRVRELEEALKFYANQNNWKDGKPTEVDGLDFFPVAAVKNDGGFIARAALERKETSHPADCFCVSCLGHPDSNSSGAD